MLCGVHTPPGRFRGHLGAKLLPDFKWLYLGRLYTVSEHTSSVFALTQGPSNPGGQLTHGINPEYLELPQDGRLSGRQFAAIRWGADPRHVVLTLRIGTAHASAPGF